MKMNACCFIQILFIGVTTKEKSMDYTLLRGQVNSVRCKKFHSFYPTAHLFPLFEEIIDETLKDKFQNDKYFYNFVTFNNLFY